MSNPINKAVIPVAGIGTRMLPATKAQRKEMLPVAGKPLIQYAVEEAAVSGIDTIVLVTGSRSASLLEHFQRDVLLEETLASQGRAREAELIRKLSDLVTVCAVEQSRPLGLGHAVYCARDLVGGEPFALILPDVIIDAAYPCTAQLIEAYGECEGSIIATRRIDSSEFQRHGVVALADSGFDDANQTFRIAGFVEKPAPEKAPSHFGVFGRYILEPEVFGCIEPDLSVGEREIQLTDALDRLAKQHSVYGVQFSGQHFDAGNPLGFLEANVSLSLNDPSLGSEFRTFLQDVLKTSQTKSARAE
jgi:UTP--glucose-1-phosphate uridylyltransferase